MLALLSAMVFLVIVRLIVRKARLAVFFVWFTLAFLGFAGTSASPVDALIQSALPALFLFGLFRFGFLTLGVALTFFLLFWAEIPITHDVSSWYGGGTLIVVALFVGMAAYALRVALAGRQLLRDELT